MSRAAAGERGLTLIELVLTLTILALAGALVSGALSTGLRAWQSGFARGREDLVARVVVERLAAQLRSVVASPSRREGEDAVAFEVREDALRFVTLSGSGAAPAQVSYALEAGERGPQLVYREYPWPDKEFFGEHQARREERVPEIAGLSVSVTRRADEEEAEPGLVQREWKPTDGVVPLKVAVELRLRGAGEAAPRTHRLEVTLPSEVLL